MFFSARIAALLDHIEALQDEVALHQEALVWAVGTRKLPPTCPGHFMRLLIAAKQKVEEIEALETTQRIEQPPNCS